ncbi:MAG TPA: alpha/beta hydrolase [Candidatus Angelobacter sp.]|nr:alpha/beta hydrolase [Candidatus Angelobacter sp.]
MPFITVGKENTGSIELYYEDHGTGSPVVLIHGWPLSGRSWEKQTQVLLDAGYRVITYDRRGFGDSSRPAAGYNYDTLAADLHQLITELNLRDATLVGFSMGGGEVARYLGVHENERVTRAVFISAIPPYLLKTADNPQGVDGSVFKGIEQAIVADRPAFLTQFLSDFYNFDILRGKLISDQVVQLSWDIAVGASPKGTLDCVSAWLTDFRSDLARIGMPTLVIHGDADRILPIAATGQRTHELVKGSQYVVVKDGPHGIIWTHAQQVNEALLSFLAQGKRSVRVA